MTSIVLTVALTAGAWPGEGSDCKSCHPGEWAEWETSRHAVARSNPVFEASYARIEHPWCLTCHSPLGEGGVGCLSCHSGPEPTDCATCHEFPFQNHAPSTPFSLSANPSQETVSEWRTSTAAAAGVGCTDCHMGERGHRFPGAHEPSMLRGFLKLEARLLGDEVEVRATAPGAAHRVPTGDPFRRIEVSLATDAECTTVVGRTSLRRTIGRTETSWAISQDRTVPPETPTSAAERVLRVDVSGRPRFWCLDYRYGDRRFEPDLPDIEVGYRIATGTVEAP